MQSAKSSKIMDYQKKLKKLLNKNVIDIIMFGSLVKGGNPSDIDIALVYNKKDQIDIVQHTDLSGLKKEIEKIVKKKSDFQIITINSLYSPIWLTLIKEGFSVSKNKYLAEIYNIKPSVLYKYSLDKLNNVQKVQFERGIKSVLRKEGVFLTRAVVMIPISLKNEMIEFLKKWDVYYESQEYELLPLLRKEGFL